MYRFIFWLCGFSLSTWLSAQTRLSVYLTDSTGTQAKTGIWLSLYRETSAGRTLIDRQCSDAEGLVDWPLLTPDRYSLQLPLMAIQLPDFELEEEQAKIMVLKLNSEQKLIAWSDRNQTYQVCDSLGLIEYQDQYDDLYRNSALRLRLDAEALTKDRRGTLAASLERLPGISSISVGVGIAKPVIRGLWGNRVQVLYEGIAQQSQQWGADHGLEIDPFEVGQIEILRGPACLRYGSEALGGSIEIEPLALQGPQGWQAEYQGLFKSNNAHWAQSARLRWRGKRWSMAFRHSLQSFADYRVPAQSFTYNGFELPLYEQRLKNTAGLEQQLGTWLGYQHQAHELRASAQLYRLDAGLFAGAVGIPRAYSLQPDSSRRDRQLPKQQVEHLRLIGRYTYRQGGQIFRLSGGYQRNERQEWSFPHIHDRPDTDSTYLALGMKLQTLSSQGRWHRNNREEYGFSLQYQWHEHRGFEFLLPAYQTWRSGIYGLRRYSFKAGQQRLEAGLRLDYGYNAYEAGGVWTLDPWSGLRYEERVQAAQAGHFNYAAVLNWEDEFRPGAWRYFAQAGKSFRLPYINELASNGIHHGTFRHELGQPNLKPEQGYQLDAGLQGQGRQWQSRLTGFLHYFEGFIYLRPTGRFSPLPEAGQLYQYAQNQVIYTGGEWEWTWRPKPWLNLHQSWEYLYNYNLQTGLGLPFSPPASVRQELELKPNWLGDKGLYLIIAQHYRFAQNRTDRNELATPASSVWDLSLGGEWQPKAGAHRLQWSVQAQNLFNTPYMLHLSRYRLLNLPEQGRNLILSIRYFWN